MEFDPSSLTSKAPSAATVKPTAWPHTRWLSTAKPVMKSSYSPFAFEVP
jgi:hypothetical protein